MTEAQHLFRVQHGCGNEEFISANYMAVDPASGILQFWNTDSLRAVAAFLPLPGLSVVRVDALVNHDNVMEKEI